MCEYNPGIEKCAIFVLSAGSSVENVGFHGQKESSSPPTDSEKQSQLQFRYLIQKKTFFFFNEIFFED